MAHPYQEHRSHKVEHNRVAKIAGKAGGGRACYARGGGVDDVEMSDGEVAKSATDRKGMNLRKDNPNLSAMGKTTKARSDRPQRARGGRTGKGKTVVNVIVGKGGGGEAAPMPMAGPPMAPPMPPPMAARPPMAPPGPPPPGMGGPPPGMPMRARGGKVAKDGPAWEEGRKHGTKVQHNDTGKIDTDDVGRGKPITYARGGSVKGVSVAVKGAKPAPGSHADDASKVSLPTKKAPPHLGVGSGSAIGRLKKTAAMERS